MIPPVNPGTPPPTPKSWRYMLNTLLDWLFEVILSLPSFTGLLRSVREKIINNFWMRKSVTLSTGNGDDLLRQKSIFWVGKSPLYCTV